MTEIVTYILGAGFSAPLGLPVMRNFLEKSKDLYFSNLDRYEHFGQIFKTIRELSVCKTYYDSDLTNIEEILSILDMKRFSNEEELASFVDYVCDVIQAFTPAITPVEWQGRPTDWHKRLFGRASRENQYGVFVANLLGLEAYFKYSIDSTGFQNRSSYDFRVSCMLDQKIQYNVITMNYDMVLEQFVDHLKKQRIFVDDKVGFRDAYSENNRLMAKLHGCAGKRSIIPPSWAKVHTVDIQRTWKHAYAALAAANHLRILGYSLPISDTYIHYLLKSSVIDSEHLKSIDVICRDSQKTVKARYDDFIRFPNYRFRNADVSSYLQALANITQAASIGERESAVQYNHLEDAHKEFMSA